MTIIQRVFVLYAFVLPSSQAYNLNESHHLSIDEARVAMTHASTNSSRFTELRDALSRIYEVAPKNEHGLLGHQTVRYVLHRFFQQRSGWFIKGLAPNETQSWHRDSSAKIEAPKIKDWVPSFLQDQLEQGSMQHLGTNLTGLVQLAVALEELVWNESRDKMEMIYHMHGWQVHRSLKFADVHALAQTFCIAFLVAGNFAWNNGSEVAKKEEIFKSKYPGASEIMQWLAKLEREHIAKMGDQFGTFESMVRLAWTIQERYHEHNDGDCQGMKDTLIEMESKKKGRARLSTFYNMSLYSSFKFNEKAEYLKALGALDDSDPQNPQVVISNYIMSRTNCLDGSSIYAVCCQNECENLLGQLESQLRSSVAEPKKIAALVSRLSTQTVYAPRALGPDLVTRLEKVAAQNNGQVPLYGRLFSQWLHHAFPRECPYPHQTGSASPVTAEEWMASSREASREEMQETVESAVCEVDDQGKLKGICEEDESLPWTDEEELLGGHFVSQNEIRSAVPSTQRLECVAAPLFVAMSLIAVGVLYWDYLSAKRDFLTSKPEEVLYVNRICQVDVKQKLSSLRKASGLWVVAFLVWALGLPDASVVGLTICSYMMVLAARTLFKRYSAGSKKIML